VGLGQARGDRLLDRKALRWNRQDTALSEASYAALGSRMPVAASARGSFGAGRASDGTGTPSPFAENSAACGLPHGRKSALELVDYRYHPHP